MKFKICLLLVAVASLFTTAATTEEHAYGRILTLGPDVSEIVVGLGALDKIAAVDRSSRYPEELNALPNVGYRRSLAAEGIMGIDPDLILAAEDIGPPEVVSLLKTLDVPIVFVPEGNSKEGILRKIDVIAKTLGEEEKAVALKAEVSNNFDSAAAFGASVPEEQRKKVVFFHGLARLTGAGSDTAADAIIRYAGGANALAEFEGYKQVSEEKMIEIAPDIVFMMPDSTGGPKPEQVFANAALKTSPAAQNNALVILDGPYMLGFGPRTAQAIHDLAAALYPELQ